MFGIKKLCECRLDLGKLRSGGINEISKQSDKCNECALKDIRLGIKDKTSGIIGRLYAEEYNKKLLGK